MKKIETLYEIRLHCSSSEEYNRIRERLLKTKKCETIAFLFEEKELFIQADHLTLDEYNRIKKISYLK